MGTLLVACGNPLRGDDGVAAEVLRLAGPAGNCALLSLHQLTPEIAAEIARFDRVIFLDADVRALTLTIEPVAARTPRSPLTHAASPGEIVALSRALFGFTGEAILCRIPAHDFTPGESAGADALQFAQKAAEEIGNLI